LYNKSVLPSKNVHLSFFQDYFITPVSGDQCLFECLNIFESLLLNISLKYRVVHVSIEIQFKNENDRRFNLPFCQFIEKVIESIEVKEKKIVIVLTKGFNNVLVLTSVLMNGQH